MYFFREMVIGAELGDFSFKRNVYGRFFIFKGPSER